jgi:hypothetical protein
MSALVAAHPDPYPAPVAKSQRDFTHESPLPDAGGMSLRKPG